ncbi:sin3 histone deacetylase corepressor complex component SDS3 isoform X2 [Ixodes scapularis]|uniref:Putative component of histone deacetyl n=1 Tax=Ixodes ricinus TaxID=34613 RepID=A0A131YA89_IXORI|nr:sin3 histone deacetylase corepressor complex component SDS3 isoform X2 [Ixodes scapularis]
MMYLQDLADFAFMHKDGGNDVDYNDDNSVDFDDFLDHEDRDSDEDTEDASETDMVKHEEQYTEIKEQMYRAKLATLKKQLAQLKEDSHPEYLKKLKRIEQVYHERRFMNDVFQTHEVERVEREYIQEKKAAVREFEEKKIDLRESLIMELEEKRRMVEAERSTIELTGDSMEVKSVTTRKLRRRPNDPLPMPEKRRKTSPTQLNFLLDETDIIDDLKTLNKGKLPSMSKRLDCEGYGNGDHSSHIFDAKIEDGKLFYERKWYQRGQSVCVESKDMGRFYGVISTVGTSEFWMKKSHDGSKIKIHLSQLLKGKIILRRKSAC